MVYNWTGLEEGVCDVPFKPCRPNQRDLGHWDGTETQETPPETFHPAEVFFSKTLNPYLPAPGVMFHKIPLCALTSLLKQKRVSFPVRSTKYCVVFMWSACGHQWMDEARID